MRSSFHKPVISLNIGVISNALNHRPSANNTKILIAEDNTANQKVISFWLEEFGYDYELVNNGEDVIKKFQSGQFSIILMDIQMYDMDGHEATKAIRQIERVNNLKPSIIMALTAQALIGDREKCLLSGMNEYFSKPLDYAKLMDCLLKYNKPMPRIAKLRLNNN